MAKKDREKTTRVYMDYNATTPLHPDVLAAMAPYFAEKYGNASSLHSFGRESRAAIDAAREKVAQLIGPTAPEDIVFTSGGTESDNFAIKGVAHALREKGRHIITSAIEHSAVLNPCKFLEDDGCRVTYLPVDKYGIVDLDALKDSITDETILITIMFANNETGTIEPIEEISKIAKDKGILFHTDAVQAAGKIPIDVDRMGIGLLSLSAHKFYGPKGIGALYINKKARITPLLHGGHHERKRRPGTENVPAIAGFGKACEIALDTMESESKRITLLRNRLEGGIINRVREVKVNGHPEKRLPNTSNVSFAGVEGEALLVNLDLKGIAVSSSSACTSGSLEPSHVLKAMGVDPVLAQGTVRFSLGRENSKEDVARVLNDLALIIRKSRAMARTGAAAR